MASARLCRVRGAIGEMLQLPVDPQDPAARAVLQAVVYMVDFGNRDVIPFEPITVCRRVLLTE